MKSLLKIITHIYKGSLIEAIKRQPQKYKRLQWEKFVKQKNHSILFNYNNFFKLKLYKDSELSQYIYQGVFEINELALVRQFLKTGDHFLDIGSNVGLFSVLASKVIGKTGIVYCFEPTPKTYKRLLENIELNKLSNIKTYQKGISNQNGTLKINTSLDGYDAWNSFAMPVCGEKFLSENVETIKLDDFFSSTNSFQNISLIKIDVEGWEKFVLLGGQEYLNKPNAPSILIECVSGITKNAGYESKELINILNSYGYKLYRIEEKKLIHEDFNNDNVNANLIAIKKETELKRRLTKWDIINN